MSATFYRLFLLLLTTLGLIAPAQAVSVAFINPGRSNEAYWVAAASAMVQAARSLNMALEVKYAERDHLKALEIAASLAARPVAQRPDYVVFSNDYATGPEILRLLNGSGIKAMMAFSGIHGADRRVTGGPREKYGFWLGTLEPRAEDAGYLTAKMLIEKGRAAQLRGADGLLHVIAIAGDRSTPSSAARNAGLQRALAEASDVVLDQIVYANWNRETAMTKSRWLVRRHAEARLVWAGSDQMAFGAMQAWREHSDVPGRDVLFSGVNTSVEALKAVRSGELAALAGGHFMAGAWAMVMIHDHAKGVDFARSEGLELVVPMFILFTPPLAERFMQRFADEQKTLDFRHYSRALNPRLTHYDFDVGDLLR